MRRGRGAALVLSTVLITSCGAGSTPPAEQSAVADVPEAAGTWERLPPAPLLPRGGTQAVWTGSEIIFWGGAAVDPTAEPCPAAADCAGPPPGPEAGEAAAYTPATGTWRRLTGTPPGYGYPVWTHGKIMDQSSSYDPPTGTSTPHPWNNLLVYARAQVIGADLVVAGWDYDLGELDGVGQVAAAALNLDDPQARWRKVEWPLPPPGAESLQTATDGTDLLVTSAASNPAICEENNTTCYRKLRFNPSAGTWTDLGPTSTSLPQASSSDHRLYGTASGDPSATGAPSTEVVTLDPADGSTTSLGDPGSAGDLLVSPAGQVAVVGGPDIRLRSDARGWERLPAVPGAPVFPAFVWAGEELVVWGGAATVGDLESRNSADGWIFRPSS